MKILQVAYCYNLKTSWIQKFFESINSVELMHTVFSLTDFEAEISSQNFDFIVVSIEDILIVGGVKQKLDTRVGAPPIVAMCCSLSPKSLYSGLSAGCSDVLRCDESQEGLLSWMATAGSMSNKLCNTSIFIAIRKLLPAEHPIQSLIDESDLEIMRLISEGKTNQEIASTIFMANQTVRNRVSRLLERTGTTNRCGLASIFTT